MKLLPILVKSISEQHGVGLWGSEVKGVNYKTKEEILHKPESDAVIGGGSSDDGAEGDTTYGNYGGFYINSPYRPPHRRNHYGIDYRANSGTPIKILKRGKVTRAGMNENPGGWGALIQIKHDDGTATRYGHVKKIYVKFDDVVEPGTIIGLTGGDASDPGRGNSEHAHLHWEWLPDGVHAKDGKDVASQYFSFN